MRAKSSQTVGPVYVENTALRKDCSMQHFAKYYRRYREYQSLAAQVESSFLVHYRRDDIIKNQYN